MLEILDPTHEMQPVNRPANPRPVSIDNVTIGLLDINKWRGDLFLDELEKQLADRGLRVKRYAKPTYAHPASVPLQQQIATECDILLEALAD